MAHSPPCPAKSDTDVAPVVEQVFSIAQLAALLAVVHLFKFPVRVASCQQRLFVPVNCLSSSRAQKRKREQHLLQSELCCHRRIMPPKFPVHPFQTEALTTTVVREVKSM